MTYKEKAQIDMLKRKVVLNKIKEKAWKSKTYGKCGKNISNDIRIINKVGYVLGRYDNNLGIYEYYNGYRWDSDLTTATLVYNDADHFNIPKDSKKGCNYAISKVFYRDVRKKLSDTFRRFSDNECIVRITLTKLNHYQILAGIVNTI